MWVVKSSLPCWIKRRFVQDCEVLGEWAMTDKEIKRAKRNAQRNLVGFTLVPVWKQELA